MKPGLPPPEEAAKRWGAHSRDVAIAEVIRREEAEGSVVAVPTFYRVPDPASDYLGAPDGYPDFARRIARETWYSARRHISPGRPRRRPIEEILPLN